MATYYIATTGTDAPGRGTLALPWLTLAYAYTNSAASDTIVLAAGTYTWLAATMVRRTIQGASALTTFIDRGSTTNTEGIVWWINNLVINDLTFRNNGGNHIAGVPQACGLFTGYVNPSTATFNRCIFTNIRVCWGADIAFGLGVFGWNFATLYFNTCLFYNVGGFGTQTNAGLFSCRFGIVLVVTFTGCTLDFGVTGIYYLNNIVQENNNPGTSVVFVNTILNNRSGLTLAWGPTAAHDSVSLTNSCAYLITSPPAAYTLTNSITTDPQFVDPANADFRLRQTSPCLDTGVLV